MSLLKLHADGTGEAVPDGLGDVPLRDAPPDRLPNGLPNGLRGEKLAEVSVDEPTRWPLGRRLLSVLGLAALAWLAVLYLPGLLNNLVGRLLGLMVEAVT